MRTPTRHIWQGGPEHTHRDDYAWKAVVGDHPPVRVHVVFVDGVRIRRADG